MTTTVLARNGNSLSGDVQAAGWMDYINGGDYTTEQQTKLVEALMAAQRAAFDALLPEGCHWYPTLSEVHGPVGAEMPDEDTDDLMRQACDTVAGRFEAIEAEALGETVNEPTLADTMTAAGWTVEHRYADGPWDGGLMVSKGDTAVNIVADPAHGQYIASPAGGSNDYTGTDAVALAESLRGVEH